MQADVFEQVMADLRGDTAPRVWSLLVTVFGDFAQVGSAIPASVLGELTTRIGIKPEAMRVALHRLRKDGWIDSTRAGRSSVYRLTPAGRAQTVAASPRIYAVGPPAEVAFLVVTDPSAPLPWNGEEVWVTPQVALTAHPPSGSESFVTPVPSSPPLPNWMRAKTCDAGVVALSYDLSARLRRLEFALDQSALPDPLQAAALRVLVVHSWRRIVLKTPKLPDFVLPDAWSGTACRHRTSRLLARLPRPLPDVLLPQT